MLTHITMSDFKKIVDGNPGDMYIVAENFQGNWSNAKGIPLSSSTPGNATSAPAPSGYGGGTTIVSRPDFRKVSKKSSVNYN